MSLHLTLSSSISLWASLWNFSPEFLVSSKISLSFLSESSFELIFPFMISISLLTFSMFMSLLLFSLLIVITGAKICSISRRIRLSTVNTWTLGMYSPSPLSSQPGSPVVGFYCFFQFLALSRTSSLYVWSISGSPAPISSPNASSRSNLISSSNSWSLPSTWASRLLTRLLILICDCSNCRFWKVTWSGST